MRPIFVFLLTFLILSMAGLAGVHAQDGDADKEDLGQQPTPTEPLGDQPGESDAEADAKVKPKAEAPEELYKQLDLFGDVFERVRGQYVDQVESKKLIAAALNGMLTSLDAHSSYLNEDDFGDMRIQTTGEFGGLGIEVTMDNGLVKVVSPIDDTPAFRAGVKPGDYITYLDEKPVMGLTLSEAVDKMRGKVGSPIKLTIRREGVAEPIQLTIKRDVIKITPVKYELKGNDKNVGYIRVTTFNQYTGKAVEDAVIDLQKQKGDHLAGFILDLRNNPGGLLDQAISTADLFLDRGEIVSTRGREEADTKRDNATPGDAANGLPIVMLINGGSASASEIVAGALQDHKRAILMGTQTFGKGSVQTVIPVAGNGAIRLTTARYYTPSGRSIQARGITPDIAVEQAKIEKVDNGMNLKEADLLHALANPDQAKALESLPEETKEDLKAVFPWQEKDAEKMSPEEKAKALKEEADAADFQLQRAVDLVNGLAITGVWERATKAGTNSADAKDAAAKPEPAKQTDKGATVDPVQPVPDTVVPASKDPAATPSAEPAIEPESAPVE